MIQTLLILSVVLSFSVMIFMLFEYRRILIKNQKLQLRVQKAERNLRHLGDLSSEVAHEIKNPLTAILCSTETLELILADQLDEVHKTSLRYMKEYGENLLRLVSDFLDLSQARTDRLEVQTESIRLSRSATSVLGLLQAQAHSKGITLQQSIEESLRVEFDSKQLKQILFNLTHNAIKFTPAGGQVLVQASRDITTDRVRIAVSDTGIGIPEERIEKVFKAYWTEAPQESVEASSGVGLGLSLCQSLAKCNGSTLVVESTPGKGTVFSFEVPVCRQSQETSRRHSVPQETLQAPLMGQRFLLLEVGEGVGDPLSQLIQAWGGMVDNVVSATELVGALQYESYDAVMIDGVCEDDDSVEEIADLVKLHRQDVNTSIIVAADNLSTEIAGVDRTLEKPFSGSLLLESLLKTGKYLTTH